MANDAFKDIINPGNVVISNIASLPGVSIPQTQVVNRRQQFISVLSDWWSTPAMPYLWMVKFELPNLLSDANLDYWNEQLLSNEWGVDSAIKNIYDPYQNTTNITGCIFAQNVEIPGEQVKVSYVGPFNRGFRPAPIVNHRFEPYQFGIDMLESNVSFVDSILRPWVILLSHYGLVARPEGTIKANLEISELAKTGDFTQDIAKRKIWNFQDCFPWKIAPDLKSYSPDEKLTVRKTEWHYTKYQMVQAN